MKRWKKSARKRVNALIRYQFLIESEIWSVQITATTGPWGATA